MLKPSKIEYNKGNRNIVLFKKKLFIKIVTDYIQRLTFLVVQFLPLLVDGF